MSRKTPAFADIDKAVKELLKEAKTFEDRKAAIDTAMKFEALRLKAKGNDFGKGFEQTGGNEDEDF